MVALVAEQPNDYTSSAMENEEREPPEQKTMVLWDVTHTTVSFKLGERP
jgi:hypothetical protein